MVVRTGQMQHAFAVVQRWLYVPKTVPYLLGGIWL